MRNRERLQCVDVERTGGVDRGIEAVHRDRGPGLARRRKPLELGLVVGAALVLGMLSAVGVAYPFGTAEDHVTGVRPTSVTTGRFDGDAYVDFVVTNESDGTVSVFLGGGDGTFDAKVDFPAGVSPTNASAGHFDDDGNLDLVVVNYDDPLYGGLSILLGDGDGGFTLAASYQTGFGPNVTMGDFDEDLDLDLAVTSFPTLQSVDSTLSILLGKGDGTFENGVSVTGVAAGDMSAGLFDDDQDLDLAVTEGDEDGNVVILLGNGDGTFAAPASYPAGLYPLRLTTGHFDDDTDLDIAVTNFVGGTVSVLLGTGNGAFAAPVAFPAAGPGQRPLGLVSGHFDDDLDLDLAVTNVPTVRDPGPSSLSILHGNGDGSFGAAVDLEVGERPISVAKGLFDDDTDHDLAVVNEESNSVSVLLDTVPEDSGSFTLTAESPFDAGGEDPWLPTTGYFDDDTDLDLAVTNSLTDTLTILLGNGDGTFVEEAVYTTGRGPHSLTTGHFDGDTDLDLAFLNLGNDSMSILLGNGDGTFEPATGAPQTVGHVVLTGHFDADADLDLAVLEGGIEHRVRIFTGNGDGTFDVGPTHPVINPTFMTAGDLDGDADIDLAVTTMHFFGGDKVSVLLGNGDGTFTDAGSAPVGRFATWVTTGYFDDDHDLDLAVTCVNDLAVSVLLGNGDGTFASHVQFQVPNAPQALTTGHFDDDAHLDIAVAASSCVSVLSGDGHGAFPKRIDYAARGGPISVTAGRFDDDTSTDIAVGLGGGSMSMLLAFLDVTAPITSIALVPSAPDGANPWYVSPVTVTVTGTDDSASGVKETRYALDPPSAPATFGELPAGDPVTGVSADGTHKLYAASVDWTGNEESPVHVDIGIDATPPTVTPVAAPGPIFLLQGPGGSVSATVTDATSQPAAASVSAPANVTSVGNKTVQLTGSDNAGNTTAVSAPYRVSYRFLGFLSPIPQTSFRRGATIPVKFRLANAAGTRIPDAVAQALLAPVCRVKVTLDGAVQTGCANYSASSDTFQFDLKVPRTIALGTHTVGIQVSAPDGSGVVNTDSTTVTIR